MRNKFLLLSVLLLSGCAHYEYDLTRPPALARHISELSETMPVDPLVYRFQTVENHLLIWIQNSTTDPILLVGDRSVIVDPTNQSHPLGSRTIAPGSYIKIILPPLEPWAYAQGPVIEGPDVRVDAHVSVGMGYHRGYYPFYRRYYFNGYYFDDYYYGGYPGYVIIYDRDDEGGPDFFHWDENTDVRMTLTFERAGKRFEQSFAFRRDRLK